ncbi:MAG: hypothetical protein BGO09_02065 [Bacteroidetes bacterium 47-18]|nr:MAG: hypothetical protein BGO09_02065 [Bacteroidetes bacterium 47-18]
MKYVPLLSIGVLCTLASRAQAPVPEAPEPPDPVEVISTDTAAGKDGGYSVSMGLSGGIKAEKANKKSRLSFTYLNMDFGVNFMHDKTDYGSAETIRFLNVPQEYRNESLFSLAQGKSWNFNLWPVKMHYKFGTSDNNYFSMSAALGLQVFNFKYTKPVHFENKTTPQVVLREDVTLTKNKLSVMYGSIPLMLHYTTKLSRNTALRFGFGMIGGMNISTWTKQKSNEINIPKNRDIMNLQRFQTSLVGEIGLPGYFTLFATYQLTDMYKYGLQQQPVSIGIRF